MLFSCRKKTESSSGQDIVPFQFAATDVRGCVYAISNFQGKIAASINTAVNLFDIRERSAESGTSSLVCLCEWNHNYLVTSLSVRDDLLVTGDAISSVAVLRLADGKFQTVARDYGPLWPLCIETLDKSTVIGADCNNNLFSFKLRPQNDKSVLERDGGYHIGETVNKFLPGHLSFNKSNASMSPKQLFFTSSGRIGVIIDATDSLSMKLSAVERNMGKIVSSPGPAEHKEWRTPVNQRGRSDAQSGAFGFLDGDYLERFLDYQPQSPEVMKIIAGSMEAERLTMKYNELRSVLEALQSMH